MEKHQHFAKFLIGKYWIRKWILIQWNMYKNNTFSFNSRKGSSLTIVFWANVMNEQWLMNNLITWKFLFKNPLVNPKKQFA